MDYQDIIKEICEEEQIKVTALSNNWILKLEKGGSIKYITGFKFGLNNHALGEILDDKYATYELLKSENISVIEHNIMYNISNHSKYASNCNSLSYCYELFEKYNNDIVIKPNNGTCGNDVYHITKQEEIASLLENLFMKNESISICPYYTLKNEYRIIILDNEIELVYKKIRLEIKGDGKNNIEKLLEINNIKNYDNIYPLEYIPKKNENIGCNWKFNLSKGAKISTEIEENIKKEIIAIAKKVSKKFNIRFASIDIVENDDNLKVLEINSGVMMTNFIKLHPTGQKIAKKIYKEAILKMFEQE